MSGFVIGPSGPPLPSDLVERLLQVETATIGHFRESGFLNPDIRAHCGEARVAGRAVTALAAGDDGTAVCLAIDRLEAGDVLVIDRAGDRHHACWGSVLACAARVRGAAGIVIDGFLTDRAVVSRDGPPVWARGVSPLTIKMRRTAGAVNVPVACGGVAVHPGDVILADENGVLAMSPEVAQDAVERALALQAAEHETLARIVDGKRLSEIYGLQDEEKQGA